MAGKTCRFICTVAILALGMLQSASPNFAAPPNPASDGVAVCTQHLKAIHQALEAYKHDHGQLPDHLSDLIPKYMPDMSLLHCPNDPGDGNMGSTQAHGDPQIPVSYSYESSGDESNGLPSPLGPFPKPDIRKSGWGSRRLVNAHQEFFYGDQVPVVRCFHHRPAEEARDAGVEDLVLNLTSSGNVYRSTFFWEDHPDTRKALMENLDHDLVLGPAKIKSDWYLGRFHEHVMSLGNAQSARLYGPQMRRIAEHLSVLSPRLIDGQRVACQIAAEFYSALGQYRTVLPLLDAARQYDGDEGDAICEDQMRAETYHALKEYEKEISIYQNLLAKRPDVPSYMTSMADAYEAWGKPEKAKTWRMRADPDLQLVGKIAPDIPLPLLTGEHTRLNDLRKGKKAFLVNFWFRGCYPCQREMPHLQKLYQALKAEGFDMVCIDYGDERDQVRKFIADGNYTFPVALGTHDRAIFGPYPVQSYPTNYLLDGDGKVVWRGVGFGPETLEQLPAELARLGLR